MSDTVQPRPPRIRPRALGPEGTLAGDFVRDRPEARRLLQPTGQAGHAVSPRLGPEAFRLTGEEARRRLESILDGRGRLVSTGQQPVLFGGPLYVLYKALSAVEAAERLEEATGEPALALFWVGSDDHDWVEAGGVRLLDLENRIREVRLAPPDGYAGRPTGVTPLPSAVEDRIDDISELLPESEFVEFYLDLARGAFRPGETLAEGFIEFLSALLAPRPLALLDAAHPRVKEASVPFLSGSLERPEEERSAVIRSSQAVQEAGYGLQMPLLEGATHIFVDLGEGRERVYREGERARLGRDGEAMGVDELLESLRTEPSRFSPNVALRPVLESWLLPVERAVLGPGELAYWAQLPELFAARDVPMPEVEPRRSWTVVEDKVGKVLTRFGVEPETFRDGGAALRARVVEDSRPGGVEESMSGLRASIGRALQDVEEAVGDELPGIRASVGKARSQLFAAVEELEEAVDGRVEERIESRLAQIDKAAVHLFPDGEPQERVQSALYYLARYDDAFLNAVDEATRSRSPGGEGRSDG